MNDQIEHEPHTIVLLGIDYLSALSIYIEPLKLSGCINIVIIETRPIHMALALSVIPIEEVISNFKDNEIGLSIQYCNDLDASMQLLSSYFTESNIPSIYHTRIFMGRDPSPSLVELRSWLHKPEGLAQILYGNLSNDTDEFNQLLHTLYNVKKYPDMPLLRTNNLLADTNSCAKTAILTASGPALDVEINQLKQYICDDVNDIFICAAGSSLGTLLREFPNTPVCCLQ